MRKEFSYAPPITPLNILHIDDHLILVDKPAGLLSVPGRGADLADCLIGRVQSLYPSTLLVHRLDMDTSGVMVFARTRVAQRHLGLQFERRHVKKVYIAWVQGQMQGKSGTVDLPLITDWPNRPMQKVDHINGKPAVTDWSVLSHESNTTCVKLRPKTGRSHQLRVHMQAVGHPILGDPFYTNETVQCVTHRLYLHAYILSFYHPDGGAWCEFSAPVPF